MFYISFYLFGRYDNMSIVEKKCLLYDYYFDNYIFCIISNTNSYK